jgi:hypothetical protein
VAANSSGPNGLSTLRWAMSLSTSGRVGVVVVIGRSFRWVSTHERSAAPVP